LRVIIQIKVLRTTPFINQVNTALCAKLIRDQLTSDAFPYPDLHLIDPDYSNTCDVGAFNGPPEVSDIGQICTSGK